MIRFPASFVFLGLLCAVTASCPAPAPKEDYTVRFLRPETWGDEIHVHTWTLNGGQKQSLDRPFPGIPMSPLGKGWYEVTVSSARDYWLNFTDGNMKSPDLRPENGGWYSGGEWSYSPPAELSVRTSTPGDLRISEVGLHYYTETPTWLEVVNVHATETAQLGGYTLRTWAISREDPGIYPREAVDFPLPDLEIPPGGYALIMGRWYGDLPSGPQTATVLKDGHLTPFWLESGVVELIRGGQTADFFPFGQDPELPLTAGAWSGPGVDPPFTVDVLGRPEVPPEAVLGWSFTRDAGNSDTDTAEDWTLNPWATPGGPGDVPAGTLDQDADGIPDSAEVPGGTFAGMPLYTWGARTGRPDIFIHVDYMDPAGLPAPDEGITPRREALDKVKAAFSPRGMEVHFDVGNLYPDGSHRLDLPDSPAKSHRVPYSPGTTLGLTYKGGSGLTSLYTYKNRFMPLARRQIFHYLLFAATQDALGSGGSSGMAELEGNDFLVTLGGWELTSSPGQAFTGEPLTGEENTLMLIHIQASTIMHELGHNLGLGHGGRRIYGSGIRVPDHTNYKPGYLSIMNYSYQLSGLPEPGNGEAMRYYWSRFSLQGRNSLSPFYPYFHRSDATDSRQFAYFARIPDNEATLGFRMDYSRGTAPVLEEYALSEPRGLGLPGSEPVDFNGSATISEAFLEEDVNQDGLKSELPDHDDWQGLVLNFQRAAAGSRNGLARELWDLKLPIIYQDLQPAIQETTLPRRQAAPGSGF